MGRSLNRMRGRTRKQSAWLGEFPYGSAKGFVLNWCCVPKIRSYNIGAAEQLSRGQLHTHNELVGGSNPSNPTTHSRFLPTFGDAPKMPTNGGLFQCVFRVSRSPEG